MRCEELRDLVPLQAAGLLDAEEEAALREHLEGGCPRCTAEVTAVREALHLLPFAGPLEEPSPVSRARLMSAVKKDLEPETTQPAAGWGKVAGASIAAALVAGFLTGNLLTRRYESVTAELRERIDSQRKELVDLRQQVGRARQSIRLVSSPAVEVIDLSGQEKRPDSAARVFWDRRRGSWQLYASNLPPAGQGKTYQLWLITPQAKISAGLFDSAAGEEAGGTVSLPPEAGTVLAAAITDEPAGGSPQPTGEVLLLGKL